MGNLISNEAIVFFDSIYGKSQMINRGFKDRRAGNVGWNVTFDPYDIKRRFYVVENYFNTEFDYENKVHRPVNGFDPNRVCLITAVDGNCGDEEYGLVATGNYRDIQKIIEHISGMRHDNVS